MQPNIRRNIPLIEKATGKVFLISECIHYVGEERFKIVKKTGYGADEKSEVIFVSEHEIDNFLKSYEVKGLKSKRQLLEGIMVEKENNFTEMRNLLFDSIRGIIDGTVDVNKAKAVSTVSQTIINSVKVELDYRKLVKDTTTQPKVIE